MSTCLTVLGYWCAFAALAAAAWSAIRHIEGDRR